MGKCCCWLAATRLDRESPGANQKWARIKKKPSKVSLERLVEAHTPLKFLTYVLPIVAKRPLLEWFLCATTAVGAQRKPLVNLNVPDP
jgi:hypothetical protein